MTSCGPGGAAESSLHPAPAADAGAQVDVSALFAAHGGFILRALVRTVPDVSVAEDIAQEVFLIAHNKRAELDHTRNVRAWLYRVAMNVAWRNRRTFARRARLRDSLSQAPRAEPVGSDPERVLVDRDHARRVRACLSALPRDQRDVFSLFELEELSGDDVAALLDIPIATVWTRLHRARARFRKAWAAQGGTDG